MLDKLADQVKGELGHITSWLINSESLDINCESVCNHVHMCILVDLDFKCF